MLFRSLNTFKDVLVRTLGDALDLEFEPGKLTRDELIAYEKNRALAGRI